MLKSDALSLLNLNKSNIRLSIQNGLLVMEFDKDIGWMALTRLEAIELVKVLADRINGMV